MRVAGVDLGRSRLRLKHILKLETLAFSLENGYLYNRHFHGPMLIYLAKLAQEVLPAVACSDGNFVASSAREA